MGRLRRVDCRDAASRLVSLTPLYAFRALSPALATRTLKATRGDMAKSVA